MTILIAAWIMSTSPFAAPDEQSHYIRALGLSQGVILGKKVPYPNPGLTIPEQVFLNRDTRAYLVPPGMSPYDVVCMRGTERPDGCLEQSPNGNFPPLGYLLAAIALRFPTNVSSALWLARAGSALQSAAFLVLALVLLWEGTAWSLLGLLAAMSPMVLFCASILNPSGVQIASALALVAAGLRITRRPAAASGWVWGALAAAGAVTILSGPIGLAFAGAGLLAVAALGGRRAAGQMWRAHPQAVPFSAMALALAAVISLAYTRYAGFSSTFGLSPFFSSLQASWDQFGGVLRVAVGNFGAQTVPLPAVACDLWFALVASLVAAALWLGGRRERAVVLATTVLALAFPVLFWAWVDRYTGFPLLGREVLPILQVIPLVAGEVVYRHRARFAESPAGRSAIGALMSFIVGFQAYAFAFNAKRAPHDVTLLPTAIFTPPLGWAPWLALGAIGLLAMGAFVVGDVAAQRAAIGPPAFVAIRDSETPPWT
jgi:hypothetical protein